MPKTRRVRKRRTTTTVQTPQRKRKPRVSQRHPFSESEDKKIIKFVEKYIPVNQRLHIPHYLWEKASEQLQRSPYAIRNRFHRFLRSKVQLPESEYVNEEDETEEESEDSVTRNLSQDLQTPHPTGRHKERPHSEKIRRVTIPIPYETRSAKPRRYVEESDEMEDESHVIEEPQERRRSERIKNLPNKNYEENMTEDEIVEHKDEEEHSEEEKIEEQPEEEEETSSRAKEFVDYLVEQTGQPAKIVLYAIYANSGQLENAINYLLTSNDFDRKKLWSFEEDQIILTHGSSQEEMAKLISEKGPEEVERRTQFLEECENIFETE